jgi:hypothetical protein
MQGCLNAQRGITSRECRTRGNQMPRYHILPQSTNLPDLKLCFSVVRACTWGEGSKYFATASDPFNTREFGSISIFEFPSDDVLSERK